MNLPPLLINQRLCSLKNTAQVISGNLNAVTAEARTALVDAVNDAYEQRLQERMEQSEDAPAQGMEQQM